MVRLVDNPPNPWATSSVEYLEDLPQTRLEVWEEEAKEVLSENESPDLGFRWSCNPYRGCTHGCAYCYARPSHQWLGFGAGTDFERKIVVKVNAPERLRAHLMRASWRGELIAFSGVTDCFQPLEASYEITRRCLEVALAFRQPVGIVTKGALVARDATLLAELARCATALVRISVPFADETLARRVEIGVGAPRKRFEAMRRLADAGVDVGVSVAPVIPGLNDDQVPAILELAKAAGATCATLTMLRLPAEVLPVFVARIQEALPLRAERVLNAIRSVRDGKLHENAFGARHRGEGPRWEMVRRLFEIQCRKLGIATTPRPVRETFRRPGQQGLLFG